MVGSVIVGSQSHVMDTTQLNEFSRRFAAVLFDAHPEWREFASVDTTEGLDEGSLLVEIPRHSHATSSSHCTSRRTGRRLRLALIATTRISIDTPMMRRLRRSLRLLPLSQALWPSKSQSFPGGTETSHAAPPALPRTQTLARHHGYTMPRPHGFGRGKGRTTKILQPNHPLQRTQPSRSGCNHGPWWASR